ncbi:MAG: hypothetical protein GX933_03835 [Chloroflexi bacterium]|nr:hypothetical protein [Chloroflexota bacterium]
MCFFRKYPAEFKAEVERLSADLLRIGNVEDFLPERPGGIFDQDCRHIRAREIGQRFYEIGGIPLMEDRVKWIAKKSGKNLGAHLEACWRSVAGQF